MKYLTLICICITLILIVYVAMNIYINKKNESFQSSNLVDVNSLATKITTSTFKEYVVIKITGKLIKLTTTTAYLFSKSSYDTYEYYPSYICSPAYKTTGSTISLNGITTQPNNTQNWDGRIMLNPENSYNLYLSFNRKMDANIVGSNTGWTAESIIYFMITIECYHVNGKFAKTYEWICATKGNNVYVPAQMTCNISGSNHIIPVITPHINNVSFADTCVSLLIERIN